jgi:cation diffusion facilitator family transporter
MIALLSRIFIKDAGNAGSPAVRKAYGVLCGAVGIFLNVLLFAGKFFAGGISGSIAVTADAFNNLSDAGSSAVTLLGFHLGGQKADREHPFGHGRLEYLSGLAVSMLIVLMGFELAKSSLEKILHPEEVQSGALVIAILCVSIAVKLYMFSYNRRLGRKLQSVAMEATAMDSFSDCIATTAVLLATLVGRATGWHIDGWCGILVAVFILYSGFSAAKETVTPLLGQPADPAFVQRIKDLVMAHERIIGIHDLLVHDYGPGRCMISLHAEVSASENVLELHDEIDNVEKELKETLGCEAVIHMDPVVTNDGITEETRERVAALVKCIDDQISIHDFRMVVGPTHTNVIFDVVVPYQFRLTDREVEEKIRTAVRALDGNYYAVMNVEKSFT